MAARQYPKQRIRRHARRYFPVSSNRFFRRRRPSHTDLPSHFYSDTKRTPFRKENDSASKERIEYLSLEDLTKLNQRVLETAKTSKHDRHALLARKEDIGAILQKVRNQQGDIYDKAVLLLTSLLDSHVFQSGNKRTAFTATSTFLELNGKDVPQMMEAKIMQGIREGFYTKEEIKEWLKGNGIREFQRFSWEQYKG